MDFFPLSHIFVLFCSFVETFKNHGSFSLLSSSFSTQRKNPSPLWFVNVYLSERWTFFYIAWIFSLCQIKSLRKYVYLSERWTFSVQPWTFFTYSFFCLAPLLKPSRIMEVFQFLQLYFLLNERILLHSLDLFSLSNYLVW